MGSKYPRLMSLPTCLLVALGRLAVAWDAKRAEEKGDVAVAIMRRGALCVLGLTDEEKGLRRRRFGPQVRWFTSPFRTTRVAPPHYLVL